MHLIENKSNILLVTKKTKNSRILNIYLNNKRLQQVSEVKYIGTYFENSFNFERHVDNFTGKSTHIINMLARSNKLNCGLGHRALKVIFNGARESILTYTPHTPHKHAHTQHTQKRHTNTNHKNTPNTHTNPPTHTHTIYLNKLTPYKQHTHHTHTPKHTHITRTPNQHTTQSHHTNPPHTHTQTTHAPHTHTIQTHHTEPHS